MEKITAEQLQAAKEKIAAEFMSRYNEFRADVAKYGETVEFGRKYGIFFQDKETAEKYGKDTQKNLCYFQQRIFTGRWLPEWERAGYDRQVIWQLAVDGFLSYQEYSNWMARHTGKTQFYYISQRIAKEIYKAAKEKK